MKKRLLASVMSLCMILSLLPVSALAEEPAETPEADPTCICETMCTEDSWNEACPVCKDGYELCAAPEDAEEEEPSAPSETPEAPLELEEETSEEPTGDAPVPPVNNSLTAKPVMLAETEPAAASAVYVSESGNDITGDGTYDNPYATLPYAVSKAQSGATVYVMSNLSLSSMVSIWEKDIILASDPKSMEENSGESFTISREENFQPRQDNRRSTYNPAMIEVGGKTNQGIVASLRLENIQLDDECISASDNDNKYFIQAIGSASTDFGDLTGISNTQIVQDAMIASYNGTATITLGNGAVLKNYGGMSAVLITGGSELIMESGSRIIDDDGILREKGTTIPGADGLYGPAGAIWMQGGVLVMKDGSEINGIVGRAIYNESGNATIGGAIINCKENSANLWQGDQGAIAHLRSHASMTLTNTGIIQNTPKDITTYKGAAIRLNTSNFTMESGASISNLNVSTGIAMGEDCNLTVKTNANIHDISYSDSVIILTAPKEYSGTPEVYFDGTVYNCTGGQRIFAFQGNVTETGTGTPYYVKIDKNAEAYHNNTDYGIIYMQGPGTVDFYGKFHDNSSDSWAAGISLANNYAYGTKLIMHEGAEIVNNQGKDEGGVHVTHGTFEMLGGTISGNTSSSTDTGHGGGGVYVGRGGRFIMEGGTISNNHSATVGGGVAFREDRLSSNTPFPYVELKGGTISDNTTGVSQTKNDLAVISGYFSNISCYLTVDKAVEISEPSIYMQKYDFYIERVNNMKLGNASTASETALTTSSAAKGWSDTLLAAFWLQSDNAVTLNLSEITKTETTLPIYALVMPTDENGDVTTGTEAAVYALTENSDETMTFAIPQGNENGYAVALVQPTTDYGTLTLTAAPTSIQEVPGTNSYTVNYTAVYDISGNLTSLIEQTDGNPNFTLTIDLDDKLTYTGGSMTINGQAASNVTTNEGTISVTFPVNSTTGQVTLSFAATAVLDGDNFDDGISLVTSGELTGTVGSTNVNVPSNSAVTTLTAYVEPTPEPEPEPTPGGSTGGGGGGSHSDPTGNLTISLGGNGGNEDFTFTVIFTDKDGDELKNKFYYNGDDSGTVGSGGEIVLTDGDKIVIRNLPEGTRYEVILENADGYTVRSTGAEGVIRTSGNEAAFSVSPTVVLADPSVTGVTRWLNTTDHMAYLTGYPGGTFGPDNSMTRAEVAQMFYALLLNKDVTITKTFSDVPADAWYATAVNTLASLGMVSGDPDGTFRPNDPITRAEFCVIALAFAYEPDNAVCSFGDVSRGDWFYPYVAQAASYGWIGGYTNGNFGPNDQITRAQVTTIVNNMLGRAADRDYVIDHQADLVQFTDLTRAHWGFFQIMEATNAHDYTKSGRQETWR